MLDGSGRAAGGFLDGIGNVGLALCRLGSMTNLDLQGMGTREELAVPEFKIGSEEGEDQVRVKAFVPDWHMLGNARRAPVTAPRAGS
jgi:mRNA-decapping enzyme subunit 2